MPSNTISFMATAFALLSATNGHMVLKTPSPYGPASIDNSPLDPSGSDFPCKQRPGVYDPPTTKNVMPIGAPQILSFKGSAVHGGGSCQISLTKDAKPTKDSKWMVIHSIEGGCPAKAEGNLKEDANGDGAAKFEYKIPPGIAPGEYTFAWTWFNKIGNREMYMNCAPITVTGGGKTRRDVHDSPDSFNATKTYASDEIFKRDTSFPEMFKANMPSTDCETEKQKDVQFPNPGQSVVKAGNPGDLAPPKGPKCGGAGGASSGSSPAVAAAGGSGSNASSAPAASMPMASPSSAGSNTGASAAPVGAPSPSITIQAIPPPGTGASTGAGAMQSVQSAAASVASAAASVASGMGDAAGPAPTASSSGASAGSSGASSGESSGSGASNATPSSGASSSSSGGSNAAAMSSTSCSTPGQLVCSDDGKMFGTCGADKTVMMMPVASGTKCQGGKIGFGKRSAKYAKAYRA